VAIHATFAEIVLRVSPGEGARDIPAREKHHYWHADDGTVDLAVAGLGHHYTVRDDAQGLLLVMAGGGGGGGGGGGHEPSIAITLRYSQRLEAARRLLIAGIDRAIEQRNKRNGALETLDMTRLPENLRRKHHLSRWVDDCYPSFAEHPGEGHQR
jgi:hypothetical protein